ncbi:mitochondrial protein [Spatholobus suberectus]|nr:mitochondrial protein [Spatholobus suberectus]
MAMYAMLRRATALSQLGRRAMASSSSRTFQNVLSVLHRETTVSVSPSLRFANAFATKTSADDNLSQVLQSEIQCALEDDHAQHRVEIPDDFPFEIEDNPGERTIQLKGQYGDETIRVQVDIPNVAPEENEDDEDGEKNASESSIPLVVSVFKGNGVCLEFGVTAFPDEISIDSLSIKQSEESEDQLAYEGPEFTDLDENLQKAFHKYLDIRGIKPSTTNFLQEYMFAKDNKEYLMWLKNLKNFVEK